MISIFTGKYPITLENLILLDRMSLNVFFNLRLPRTFMAVFAGITLAFAGWVYQALFKNPIASPDMIGVSSSACVGAGIGIVFLGGATVVIACSAFLGGLVAVILTNFLSKLSKSARMSNLILSGITVNAFAQSVLMIIKLSADPEKQLASIEYWTMGSFSSMTMEKFIMIIPFILATIFLTIKFQRQLSILSLDSDMGKMLGADVGKLRMILMIIVTIGVGAVVSVTGLISFVGLIAPHIARTRFKNNNKQTMLFAGLMGANLLLFSDIVARSILASEMPVSIVCSILAIPFLISLIVKGEKM